MANTGNTQQIINYGATANDGTGDPLRTAFIKTDENFDNVWLAGPVGSNVTISNNTIQTNNTNGNITIKPNGTGIIQANASIIPNSAGTRDLGSSALSWRRAYIDALLPETLTVSGDATIGGNLTVQGDTIQIGNITTDTLTIQLANTASNKTAANGAGITVGANDAIATFLFNSTSNTWTTNIGANVSGNITAGYFIGNGSLLTGITGSYSNANVANYLPTYSGNISAGNISVSNNVSILQNLNVKTGSFTGDATGTNSIYAGVPLFTVLGSDVVAQFSGNVNDYTQFNFQNGNSGTLASGDYVITANNGDDETFFFNMGLGSNNHSDPDFFGDTSTPNDAYIYVVGADATGPGDTGPGNLLIGSTNGAIKMFVGNTAQANVVQTVTRSGVDVTGNITANYFSGNGSLLTGISASTGNFVFASNQMSIANTVMEIVATGTGADVDIEAADAVFIEALAGEVDIRSADDTFIATNSGGNIWTFGIDGTLTAPGNISAGNINVSDSVNITQNLNVKTGTFTGDAAGDNSIYAGFPTFTNLGSDVVAQFSGNTDAYIQFNFQNGNTGNQASGDYVITADNGNDTTHFLNIGLTGSNWNGTQPNSLSSRIGPNDGYMYVQDGNLAIGVKDGNLTGWIWRFDITGSVTADGNLIPSANGVYSLGNSTNYWANLWVANNTMYLGGVPLGMTSGNVLTVNGNAVLSNNSNTAVTTTGNITAGNVLTGGRVSATGNVTGGNILTGGLISATGNITGNYFIGDGSQLTNLPGGGLPIANGTSNINIATANGNVTVTASGTETWTFGDDGLLTLPGGNVQLGNQYGAQAILAINEPFGVVSQGNVGYTVIQWIDDIGNTNALSAISINGPGGNTGDIIVTTGGIGANANVWTFDTTGTLTLPRGGIVYETGIPGGALAGNTIALKPQGGTDADQQLLIYPTVGPVTDVNHLHLTTGNLYNTELFLGNDDLYVKLANTGNVVVNSNDSAGNTAQWTFGTDSALTLPASSGQIGRSGYPNGIDLYNNNGGTGYVRMNYADESLISADSGGAHVQTTGGTWDFDTTGNLTAPGNVSVVGNIIGGNLVTSGSGGDITMSGGNITGAGNISATGNVTGGNILGNGASMTGVATQVTGSWTVTTGTNNYSFTVPINNTYQLWVLGNIPNGIIVYNATVSVSNTNVPVIGQQFAWNYEGGGNILMFNSIPAQIIGTAGAISNASPSVGTTTNVFTFGINNTSGNTVTVNYGYTKIS